MEKGIKLIISIICFVVALAVTVAIASKGMYDYLIVSVPFTVILGIWASNNLINQKSNPLEEYNRTLNKLTRVYDPILVNTDKFPKLNNKSILNAKKFTDLVDAQVESRKPVYYIKGENSTAFYLVNDDIFLVYFLKVNEEEMCDLEDELKKVEFKSSINLDAVKDFDRTVVVQANDKSYKVSPIRDKKDENKKEEEKKEEKVEEIKEEDKKEKVEEVKEDKKEEKKEQVIENKEYKEFIDFYKTLNNQNVDFSHLSEKQINRFKSLIEDLETATNNFTIKINEDEVKEVKRIMKLINFGKDDIELL